MAAEDLLGRRVRAKYGRKGEGRIVEVAQDGVPVVAWDSDDRSRVPMRQRLEWLEVLPEDAKRAERRAVLADAESASIDELEAASDALDRLRAEGAELGVEAYGEAVKVTMDSKIVAAIEVQWKTALAHQGMTLVLWSNAAVARLHEALGLWLEARRD